MTKCWQPLVVSVLLLAGCVGAIDADQGTTGAGAPAGGGIDDPGTNPGLQPGTTGPGVQGAGGIGGPIGGSTNAPGAGPGTNPGAQPLRRLTRYEYQRTVRDLFAGVPGVDVLARDLARGLPPEDGKYTYDTFDAAGIVDSGASGHAGKYYEAALALSDAVVKNLAAVSPCDKANVGEEGCARVLAEGLGSRAFRRPLVMDEVSAMVGRYQAARTDGGTHEEGLAAVTQRILQSPHFVYHLELGMPAPGNSGMRLPSHYEMASRLSYLLWGTMPDEALRAAAAAGKLADPADIEREAKRLIADPKARLGVQHFLDQWLDLGAIDGTDKSSKLFAGFTDARPRLKTELQTFLDDAFWQDGSLGGLLSAPHTYVDAKLATFYGLPVPAGAGFVKTQPDPQRFAGLFTQGALWAALAHPDMTAPVQRGAFIRERLLCLAVPPPPMNVDVKEPVPTTARTTRQLFEEIPAQGAACAACHTPMHGVGFLMENLDAVGRWRTQEGSLPVDASGKIQGSRSSDADLVGPVELGRHLAARGEVAECLATQWFRFAFGRDDGAEDAATLSWLSGRFKELKQDMRLLPTLLTATPTFRFLPAANQGGSP